MHVTSEWLSQTRTDRQALIVAGELDPLVAASATRELAAGITDARYREVPKAAHSVLAEGGAALLNEIVAFLQS